MRGAVFTGNNTLQLVDVDAYDTYAVSQVVARALVGQGLKSWFFMTADYAFGTALERDATKTIKSLGGTVLGGTKNPPFNSDYSSARFSERMHGAKPTDDATVRHLHRRPQPPLDV